MIRFAPTILFASLLAGASCEPQAPPEGAPGRPAAPETTDDPGAPEETAVDPRLADAHLAFSFRLLRAVHEGHGPGDNVFLSPFSVATALGVVLNGAAGETREAIAEALGVARIEEAELNRAQSELIRALEQADPESDLAIANSLWLRDDAPFHEEFLRTAREDLGARIESLDFRRADAADVINAWVAEATRGRIEQIVDRIRPLDILFVLNAVYFKARWSDPFDPERTRERPFHFADGPRDHPFMHKRGDFLYFEDDEVQAVSLPYGEEERFRLDVFLPRQETNLAELVGGLDAERWSDWQGRFAEREGRLALPRFRVEERYELNEPLKRLDMEVAFDPGRADLSRLTPGRAYVDRVGHRTFVEVNEEGTEAAAVTEVVVGLTAAVDRPEPFEMVVDRPFLCAIRDSDSGLVLFLGTIAAPQPGEAP